MRALRLEDNHAHAYMIYEPTDIRHFWALFLSFIVAKNHHAISLTTHLPFETQHYSRFSKKQRITAILLILFGEVLKNIFKTPLYWENCPIFRVGIWDLAYGPTEWKHIPKNIMLCLDTGHLMMGSKDIQEARIRIQQILKDRGEQIKHLHIHENGLEHDDHIDPRSKQGKVITKELLNELQKNRTFIFEKQS